MTLLDAHKGHRYTVVSYKKSPEFPADLKRRGLNKTSVFTYVGRVGPHCILKFGGMRIAIHQTMAKALDVEGYTDENRPGR